MFRGHRATKRKVAPIGPRLVDVARRAEVTVGTASAVLSGKPVVAEATAARVLAAAEELGYVRGRPAGQLAAHWRRNGFATWLFQPAAPADIPPRLPGRSVRCRSSPTRGLAFRSGDAGRRPRLMSAGHRSRPG
ncbi:LacI family DNA-binding transcriptional regulator [Couchioplanes azureus]|uniref:LacI family DNA-binding transcriptional regulator n=1 Tax=Couchioplanes caeruleus TaxID=56438 RepID=UPI0027E51882|nr:LacI family DNA-binding transcriptional regulator [Couchioplanes caeruleus]